MIILPCISNIIINPEHISTRVNKLHKNVQFKLMAGNHTVSYWDFILGTVYFIKPYCCTSFEVTFLGC